MYRKTFGCLCRQTICRIYTIFNPVHAMSDINNIYQFQDIWRIFTRVRAWTDGQTDIQTECMNTFQLFWKVLKRHLITNFNSRLTIWLFFEWAEKRLRKKELPEKIALEKGSRMKEPLINWHFLHPKDIRETSFYDHLPKRP